MKGKALFVLLLASAFRLAFVFKPQQYTTANATDAAIEIAGDLVVKVEAKHGKIDFNA